MNKLPYDSGSGRTDREALNTENKTSVLNVPYEKAALLAYIPFFPINVIFAAIWFVTEKENKFLQFHSMQSLVTTGAFVAVSVVLSIVSGIFAFIPFLGGILLPLVWITETACVAAWVVLNVMALNSAYKGNMFHMPLIGDITDQILGNKE